MAYDITTKVRVFFDSSQLEGRLSRATKNTLSKFGAYVRRAARSSMRPARRQQLREMTSEERERHNRQKKANKAAGRNPPKRRWASSKPDEPPRVHIGDLKKYLFFSYDLSRESVIVGPVPRSGAEPDIPRRLESGGRTVSSFGRNRGKSINVAPRPYMQPALDKELPKLEPLWRDRIEKV